jgi:hypothetical protein
VGLKTSNTSQYVSVYVLCLSDKGSGRAGSFFSLFVTDVPFETQPRIQQYMLAYMWHQYSKTNELLVRLRSLFVMLRQRCRAYHSMSYKFCTIEIFCVPKFCSQCVYCCLVRYFLLRVRTNKLFTKTNSRFGYEANVREWTHALLRNTSCCTTYAQMATV